MARVLSGRAIAEELADCEVLLSPSALEQLSCYLELLLRWNRRINLTGLREPGTIVRRLFGESLYLGRVVELRGWLVDIGSGAGFPGLALKLVAPTLRVTLIESHRRKCAFLKEAARSCRFSGVGVVAEGFESWVRSRKREEKADIITTRAVNVDMHLLDGIARILAPGGRAIFLTTGKLAKRIQAQALGWRWEPTQVVPGSGDSLILVGWPLFR